MIVSFKKTNLNNTIRTYWLTTKRAFYYKICYQLFNLFKWEEQTVQSSPFIGFTRVISTISIYFKNELKIITKKIYIN